MHKLGLTATNREFVIYTYKRERHNQMLYKLLTVWTIYHLTQHFAHLTIYDSQQV